MDPERASTFLKTYRTKPVHFVKEEEYRSFDRPAASGEAVTFIGVNGLHVEAFQTVARQIVDALDYPEEGAIGPSALADILFDPDWLGRAGLVVEILDSRKAWAVAYDACALLATVWLDVWPHWRDGERPFHLVFVERQRR